MAGTNHVAARYSQKQSGDGIGGGLGRLGSESTHKINPQIAYNVQLSIDLQ